MSTFNRLSGLIFRLISAGGKNLPVLVVLILTVCVFQSWSRATTKVCGTEFHDTVSSAYRADIVIEAKVIRIRRPHPSRASWVGERYNISARIKPKKKSVFKGTTILGNGKTLLIGEFGAENSDSCVTEVKTGSKYIFFLNVTVDRKYYRINAFPINSSRKLKKLIRNCKSQDCGVKPPSVKLIKKSPKNGRVRRGGKLRLQCRARGNPLPLVTWMKDGQPVEKSSRIRVNDQRRRKEVRTTLEMRKFTSDDAGNFTCLVRNVLGSHVQPVSISVKGKKKATVQTHLWQYHPCPDEDKRRPYCLNNGTCVITVQGVRYCQCPREFLGHRCEIRDFISLIENLESKQQLARDRTIIILGILISVLVFIAICIASYLLAKDKKDQFRKRRELRKQREAAENSYRLLVDEIDAGGKLATAKNTNKHPSGNRDVVITRAIAERDHQVHCQTANFSPDSPQIVVSAPKNRDAPGRPRFFASSSDDSGKRPSGNKPLSSSNEQLLTHSSSNNGQDGHNLNNNIDAVDGLPKTDYPAMPLSGDVIPMHDMPPRNESCHNSKAGEQPRNNNNTRDYNSNNNNNNNSNDSENDEFSGTTTPPPALSQEHHESQPPPLPRSEFMDEDDVGCSDTYSDDSDTLNEDEDNDDSIPEAANVKYAKVLPLHISENDLLAPHCRPSNSDYQPNKFPLNLSPLEPPLDSPDKDLLSSVCSDSRSSIPFSESAPELYDNVHIPKKKKVPTATLR